MTSSLLPRLFALVAGRQRRCRDRLALLRARIDRRLGRRRARLQPRRDALCRSSCCARRLHDPMSGFFAIRRETRRGVAAAPVGPRLQDPVRSAHAPARSRCARSSCPIASARAPRARASSAPASCSIICVMIADRLIRRVSAVALRDVRGRRHAGPRRPSRRAAGDAGARHRLSRRRRPPRC